MAATTPSTASGYDLDGEVDDDGDGAFDVSTSAAPSTALDDKTDSGFTVDGFTAFANDGALSPRKTTEVP